MELEETEQVSEDKVNGIDRFLVGSGVAALALLPSYAALIANPARLFPHMDPDVAERSRPPFLGPGLFFVASVLLIILIANFASLVSGPPEPERIEAARETTGGAYRFGQALGGLMDTFQERLASGNVWSAATAVIPVFGFAIALALPLRILLGWAAPRWTTVHAVSASLYMTGGLLIGTSLVVLVGLVAGLWLSPAGASIIGFFGLLAILILTGTQTYGFGKAAGAKEDAPLTIAAIATPLCVLALLFACAALAVLALPDA